MKFGEVLVDKNRLTELTGISEKTAQRRIKNGDFEEPIHFVRSGVGRTAKYLYRVELIQDWQVSHLAKIS